MLTQIWFPRGGWFRTYFIKLAQTCIKLGGFTWRTLAVKLIGLGMKKRLLKVGPDTQIKLKWGIA